MGEIQVPEVAKVFLPKVHYKLMHLKLQNFKSVNTSTWSCKSTPSKSLLWIDAPEVAKYQECKWVQFYTWCT